MDKKNRCKIGFDGKSLFLLDKNNNALWGQTKLTIVDEVGGLPYATLTLCINLDEVIDLRTKKKITVKKQIFNIIKKILRYD